MTAYTIGVDYGSNSVRSVVVRTSDGLEAGTSIFEYPSGTLGILLDPQNHLLARQHPGDYLVGLEQSITGAIANAQNADPQFTPAQVIGIGIDSTGSSPIPVNQSNEALAMLEEWRGNLHAQCWLWKDHTSIQEASIITEYARIHRPHFVQKCGNTYSSEWFWAKIWHCLNVAPEVFQAAYSWVELCDWIPSQLAGISDPTKIKRSICAAGHKALYSDDWNGLPDLEFLSLLNPKLAELRPRLYEKAYDASTSAGTLSLDWANSLGLPNGIPISMGAFDVHYGAIGAGIDEGVLVKVMGTSSCDCVVVNAVQKIADIPGICGIVNGSILPNFYGIEAGQSAVGDIFAWFVRSILNEGSLAHERLTRDAENLSPGESGLLALDWNNGNRTILVDPELTGLILGQTIHTSQAEVYRALIEATAFGARMILDRIEVYGVPLHKIICAGGIADKNPMLMQIYADITGRTIEISNSSQTCALGSAICAAVLAGSSKQGYDDFKSAQRAMTRVKAHSYKPTPSAHAVYNLIFDEYQKLHNAFGGVELQDLSAVMKNLLHIKQSTLHKKHAKA